LIIFSFITPQIALGSEISLVPEKELFGPNDWIRIFVSIDGYSGGVITWNATKPDGSVLSGTLSSLKASKVTHDIVRNAFDHEFGTWKIDYDYNHIKKSINVEVEPLLLLVTADKLSYGPGDIAEVKFDTNYYVSNAAKAETIHIQILDENGIPAKSVKDVILKIYQPTTVEHFLVDDLLKYNPPGNYHAIVTYYNLQVDLPFAAGVDNSKTTLFLGTNKNLYDPGEPVEINIVIPDVSVKSGTLNVISPSGKVTTKIISDISSMNRIVFDDITSSEIGTYTIKFLYGENVGIKTFDVLAESLEKPSYSSEINSDIHIPDWVRNNADWWAKNQITDDDFAAGIEFMIKEKFILIPNLIKSESSMSEIPTWIKNTAGWWADGLISDQEFAKSIEFLVTSGIIKI